MLRYRGRQGIAVDTVSKILVYHSATMVSSYESEPFIKSGTFEVCIGWHVSWSEKAVWVYAPLALSRGAHVCLMLLQPSLLLPILLLQAFSLTPLSHGNRRLDSSTRQAGTPLRAIHTPRPLSHAVLCRDDSKSARAGKGAEETREIRRKVLEAEKSSS